MKRIWAFLAVLSLLAGLIGSVSAQGPTPQQPTPRGNPPSAVSRTAPGPAPAGPVRPGGAGGGVENVGASTVSSVNPYLLPTGVAFDLCFTVFVQSPDAEYMDHLDVDLPDSWTVNSVAADSVPPANGCGAALPPVVGVGAGNVVYWQSTGYPPQTGCGAWNGGTGGTNFDFCANITVPDCAGAPWSFPWNYIGDGWGSAPHSVSGSIGADCLQPGLFLTPEELGVSGCNDTPQVHTFDLFNNTGSDGDFAMLYTVLTGNGTLTGPDVVSVANGATASFDVVLSPDACLEPGDLLIATIDATGNGYSDLSVIFKTITGPYWELRAPHPLACFDWVVESAINPADGLEYTYVAGCNTTTTYRYDPRNDVWTSMLGTTPDFLYDGGDGVAYNGYIYARTDGQAGLTGQLFIYDIANDTWLSQAVPPTVTDRLWYEAVELDGWIYFIGGSTSYPTPTTNEVDRYNLATGTWETVAPMLYNRALAMSWAYDGKIYVAGGFDDVSDLASTEVYDPATNTWTEDAGLFAPLPVTWWGAGDAVKHGNQLWLTGGYNSTFTNETLYWDPASNTWYYGPPMQQSASQVESDTQEGDIYTVGGYTGAWLNFNQHMVQCPFGLYAWKGAPAFAAHDERIAYTIVITPCELVPGMFMTDVLPFGVQYAGNLTWDLGNAWYDPGANAVYWNYFPKAAGGAPAWTAPSASDVKPSSLLDRGPSNVGRDAGVAAAPTPMQGELLLDQQPNQSNGIFADASCDLCGGAQVLAENFSLAEPETIGQIVLWSGYYPTDTPIDPDDLTVIFHQDAAGLPGAVIASESPVAYERVQTGVVLFGVHEWMHTLTLATPVALGPGNYWIEIYNDTGWGTDDYFWEAGNPDTIGNGLPGSGFAFEAPGSTWYYDDVTELALQLIAAPVIHVTFDVTVTAGCGDEIVNTGIAGLAGDVKEFAAATEVVGEADAVVSTDTLFDELCPDAIDVVTFTVCNEGNCQLDWDLIELTGSARLAQAPYREPPAPTPPPPAAAQVKPFAGPTGDRPNVSASPEAVLWDQPTNGLQAIIDQFFPDFGVGVYSADDFIVDTWWKVDTIFQDGAALGAGGLSNAYMLVWLIYPDAGGEPAGNPDIGGDIWGLALPPFHPAVTLSGANLDEVAVNLEAAGQNLILPPGHYWLVAFPVLNLTLYSQYFWDTSDAVQEYTAKLIDPSDLLGNGWTDWTDWTVIDPTAQAAAFRIEGTAFQPGEIPWLSEMPQSGVVDPGACQVISATYDSTGLLPGDYFGDLLMASTDPDMPTMTISAQLTVDQPAALVSVTYVITGLSVAFDATAAGSEPISYLWSFGDGITSTLEDPVHAYAEARCYTVTLDIANACGADSWTAQICACDPVDLLEVTTDTAGCMVGFTPVYTGSAPFTWLWDFGDGVTDTVEMPTHSYAPPGGTFTVTVKVWNCDPVGYDTLSLTVAVSCSIYQPDITVDPLLVTATLNPDQATARTVTIGNVGTADLTWNLSEVPDEAWLTETPVSGTIAPTDSMDVEVAFDSTGLAAGTYMTSLEIASNDPDEPLVTVDVVLYVVTECLPITGPDFTWSPVPPLAGTATHFTATVTGGSEPISYTWDFGDGGGATGSANVSYIYSAGGTFTVTLTVENACSGPFTVQYVLTVQQARWSIYLPLILKGWAAP